MDSAQRCRDQSDECLRLMQAAHSETEARILKDLAQSWLRIANQTERYVNFVNRVGPPRPIAGIQKPTGARPFKRVPSIHSEPGNLPISLSELGGAGVMRRR